MGGLALIQTDSELSAILMRAFILRRVELIARRVSDVVVLGSPHCKGTLRVREFLTRNGHPHTILDLDRDAGDQELLDRFHVTAADIPVVITCTEVVLRNPTNQQIADALGFNDAIDQTQVRDLVIMGAGAFVGVRRRFKQRCFASGHVIKGLFKFEISLNQSLRHWRTTGSSGS